MKSERGVYLRTTFLATRTRWICFCLLMAQKACRGAEEVKAVYWTPVPPLEAGVFRERLPGRSSVAGCFEELTKSDFCEQILVSLPQSQGASDLQTTGEPSWSWESQRQLHLLSSRIHYGKAWRHCPLEFLLLSFFCLFCVSWPSE